VGFNTESATHKTLLRTRPWHRWCVQEISAQSPGSIAKHLSEFRPSVAVVTMIGSDHMRAYRSADAIAEEKANLVRALPEDGLAILNADDPRILAMSSMTKARVVTYGQSASADLRAVDISGAFPNLLAFTVLWNNTSRKFQTRFVGEHWITSILAALVCALEQGVTLEQATAIETFEPVLNRNSLHRVVEGPIFISDSAKAPFGSIPATIDLLASAQAPRKTLILGNISDFNGSSNPKYRKTARDAISAGARVIAVGSNAAAIRKLKDSFPSGTIEIFPGAREARDFLAADTVADELIVLKSAASGHIERIMLNWDAGNESCWEENCGLKYCASCRYLNNNKKPIS